MHFRSLKCHGNEWGQPSGPIVVFSQVAPGALHAATPAPLTLVPYQHASYGMCCVVRTPLSLAALFEHGECAPAFEAWSATLRPAFPRSEERQMRASSRYLPNPPRWGLIRQLAQYSCGQFSSQGRLGPPRMSSACTPLHGKCAGCCKIGKLMDGAEPIPRSRHCSQFHCSGSYGHNWN